MREFNIISGGLDLNTRWYYLRRCMSSIHHLGRRRVSRVSTICYHVTWTWIGLALRLCGKEDVDLRCFDLTAILSITTVWYRRKARETGGQGFRLDGYSFTILRTCGLTWIILDIKLCIGP